MSARGCRGCAAALRRDEGRSAPPRASRAPPPRRVSGALGAAAPVGAAAKTVDSRAPASFQHPPAASFGSRSPAEQLCRNCLVSLAASPSCASCDTLTQKSPSEYPSFTRFPRVPGRWPLALLETSRADQRGNALGDADRPWTPPNLFQKPSVSGRLAFVSCPCRQTPPPFLLARSVRLSPSLLFFLQPVS